MMRPRGGLAGPCIFLIALVATAGHLVLGVEPTTKAASGKLELVSTVWPPFTDVAGRPRRASDLVHEALKRAGVLEETSIVADDRLIPSLSDGSYAGSGALWYSAERERFLLYSKPYMETRLVLVGRKGQDVSASSLASLTGKRVALVKTWAYGPAVDEATATTFVRGDSMEDNLQAVLDGNVDYTIIDDLVIRSIVEAYPQDARGRLAVGTAPLVVRPLHFAVRRDVPGAEEIVARFNDQIQGMLLDGSYNRILHMTWIRADADGDGQQELVLGGERAGVSPPTDAYEIVSKTEPPKEGEKDGEPKNLRILIGKDLYKDWKSVPDHYKVPPTTASLDPEAPAEPLIKIKW